MTSRALARLLSASVGGILTGDPAAEGGLSSWGDEKGSGGCGSLLIVGLPTARLQRDFLINSIGLQQYNMPEAFDLFYRNILSMAEQDCIASA